MNALIVSPDSRQIAALTSALSGSDAGLFVQAFEGTLDGQVVLPAKGNIDLLLLDCTSHSTPQFQGLERLAPLYPGMNTILIADQDSPKLLMQAMRLGVREIVAPPVQRDELLKAVRRLTQQQRSASNLHGKVAALISCKGGSGATFLATNLGYALASNEGKRVLLIDLNLQFGDAALFISDRRPPATLADIVRDIDRLDESLLQSAMITVLPNFGVIAAPEDPALAGEIKPQPIETLIRFARTHFDFVLLDVGRSLDAVSIQALDMADLIYPVFQLTLPFIRDGKRLLGLFSSLNYPREKVCPIVNRYEKSNELSIEDLERAIATKVYGTVPNHYESVAASVNQGVPIQKLYRNSPVTRSLQQLAKQMVESRADEKRGWLGRLFARPASA